MPRQEEAVSISKVQHVSYLLLIVLIINHTGIDHPIDQLIISTRIVLWMKYILVLACWSVVGSLKKFNSKQLKSKYTNEPEVKIIVTYRTIRMQRRKLNYIRTCRFIESTVPEVNTCNSISVSVKTNFPLYNRDVTQKTLLVEWAKQIIWGMK